MLKYVKIVLLAGALGVAMSGCVDSDDPDFQVGLGQTAYVIQKNTQSGGKQFALYATIEAAYGTATSVELVKDYLPLPLNKLFDNFYEINEWRMMWGPLASVNGTYTISAQDEKGIAAQSQFKLQIDKEMGELNITEPLKYENGRLTAKWKEVDGATKYYFLLGIGEKDGDTYKFSRINTTYCGECYVNEHDVIGTLMPYNLGLSNITQETELIVAVVAGAGNGVFLEGDYYKIVLGQNGITPVTTPVLGVY